MFSRVLIANRGEIALRIIRTLREMGITSVAVYSDADRSALFVKEADEAYYLGPSSPLQSYLDGSAIINLARQSHSEAIHPGYGFLAENAGFAEAVGEAGLTFIGPSVEAIRVMGDKVAARRAVQGLGVQVVPGTAGPVANLEDALSFAGTAGYPVAVKAAGGGGGRGIRVVRSPEEMQTALEGARREAETYFKNPEVYLERYFDDPRHIEIQVLGDGTGRLVHLGERDCSTQRRHQKLIEETPSPAVDRELRARIGDAALRAAGSVGYTSAGTVEFLLSREGEYYFLEMNTRIQVEHPVTELVTGVDLIREMVLIAAGEPMTMRESILDLNGHAIELRVNAEDPHSDFRPTPTAITAYREPGGIGVRVDAGVYAGYSIPQSYDSLLGKLILWAPNREQARRRALRALEEYLIDGPATTLGFSAAVLRHPVFRAGEVGTGFVENHLVELLASVPATAPTPPLAAGCDGARTFDIEVNRKLFTVRLAEQTGARQAPPERTRSRPVRRGSSEVLLSPMHGTVIAVKKPAGEPVQEGETLFIIEAMKMENEVAAHRSGVLKQVDVAAGETVETEQPLATIV